MKPALVLAATLASLSVPGAMAQTNSIDPERLSTQQVHEIQSALNKQGFNTGNADGMWSSATEAAIKKFQQQNNLQANGEVDQQTLSALGVNVSSSKSTGSSQPTSPRSNSKSPNFRR